MADNKPKVDRRDEQARDNAEIDNSQPEVGGAGGQAESTGRSDKEDSYNSDDFYAEETS